MKSWPWMEWSDDSVKKEWLSVLVSLLCVFVWLCDRFQNRAHNVLVQYALPHLLQSVPYVWWNNIYSQCVLRGAFRGMCSALWVRMCAVDESGSVTLWLCVLLQVFMHWFLSQVNPLSVWQTYANRLANVTQEIVMVKWNKYVAACRHV